VINIVIISTNYRFKYAINEILSKIKEIKIDHTLPSDPFPERVDVVISTEIEKHTINFDKIFIPKAYNIMYLYSNIYLLANNKDRFENITIGIDPGKIIGFAVLSDDGTILNATDLYSVTDVIKETISAYFNIETNDFIVKIGGGGEKTREEIITKLEKTFHRKILVKIVNEDNTSIGRKRHISAKYGKNATSAILIAKR
jgi:hypothetical protein